LILAAEAEKKEAVGEVGEVEGNSMKLTQLLLGLMVAGRILHTGGKFREIFLKKKFPRN
jgi:hypothetical protein